jgi:hypothetical protein
MGIDSTKVKERISKNSKNEKLSVLVKRKHAQIEDNEDEMIDEEE